MVNVSPGGSNHFNAFPGGKQILILLYLSWYFLGRSIKGRLGHAHRWWQGLCGRFFRRCKFCSRDMRSAIGYLYHGIWNGFISMINRMKNYLRSDHILTTVVRTMQDDRPQIRGAVIQVPYCHLPEGQCRWAWGEPCIPCRHCHACMKVRYINTVMEPFARAGTYHYAPTRTGTWIPYWFIVPCTLGPTQKRPWFMRVSTCHHQYRYALPTGGRPDLRHLSHANVSNLEERYVGAFLSTGTSRDSMPSGKWQYSLDELHSWSWGLLTVLDVILVALWSLKFSWMFITLFL